MAEKNIQLQAQNKDSLYPKTKLENIKDFPTTTTAGKVLKSTSNANVLEWGDGGSSEPLPYERCDLDVFRHTNNDSVCNNLLTWRYGNVKLSLVEDFPGYDNITVDYLKAYDNTGARDSRCLKFLRPESVEYYGRIAVGNTPELASAVLSHDFDTQIKLFLATNNSTAPTIITTTIQKCDIMYVSEFGTAKYLKFTVADSSPLNGTTVYYIPSCNWTTDYIAGAYLGDALNYCDVWRFEDLDTSVSEIYIAAYVVNGKYYSRILDETSPNSIDRLNYLPNIESERFAVKTLQVFPLTDSTKEFSNTIDTRKLGSYVTTVASPGTTSSIITDISSLLELDIWNSFIWPLMYLDIAYKNGTTEKMGLYESRSENFTGYIDLYHNAHSGTDSEGNPANTSMFTYVRRAKSETEMIYSDMLALTFDDTLLANISTITLVVATAYNNNASMCAKIKKHKVDNSLMSTYADAILHTEYGDSVQDRFPGVSILGQGNYVDTTKSQEVIIVGNGAHNNDGELVRSNAATIDWNGDAWFSGNAYVGSTSGTHKDAGSKKLANVYTTTMTPKNAPDEEYSCTDTYASLSAKLDMGDVVIAKIIPPVPNAAGQYFSDISCVLMKNTFIVGSSSYESLHGMAVYRSENLNNDGLYLYEVNYVTAEGTDALQVKKIYIPRPETIKQEKLTAGTNITISEENVISATDTKYTAGTGIKIENNVISVAPSTQNDYDELLTKYNNLLERVEALENK